MARRGARPIPEGSAFEVAEERMNKGYSISRQQSPWLFLGFLVLLIGIPLLVLVQVFANLERHREEKMQARGRQRLQQVQAVLERAYDPRVHLSRYLRLDAERVVQKAEARGLSREACLEELKRHLQKRYGPMPGVRWALNLDPAPPVLLEMDATDGLSSASVRLLVPAILMVDVEDEYLERPTRFFQALWQRVKRLCRNVYFLPPLAWNSLFPDFPALHFKATYFQRIPQTTSTFADLTSKELVLLHRMLLRKAGFSGSHYRDGLREEAMRPIGLIFGSWMSFERLDYVLEGSAGMLSPVIIRGKEQLLCWFPILQPCWQNDLKRLPPVPGTFNAKCREISSSFLGTVLFFLDGHRDWTKAGVRALIHTLGNDGVRAAVYLPGFGNRLLVSHPALKLTPQLQTRLGQEGLIIQQGDTLFVRTSIQLGGAFPTILAVKWRETQGPETPRRNSILIFGAALAGLYTFLFLIRPFHVSLRLQLPILFFLVMAPPVLQGLMTVDQLVLERQFRLDSGARKRLEIALDGMDHSLEIGMAWPVAFMKATIASAARFSDWLPGDAPASPAERFERSMEYLPRHGLQVNLAGQHIQGQTSRMASVFRSRESTQEGQFLELFGAVVSGVFQQVQPRTETSSGRPTGKELGIGVKASEVVSILQRLLFAESFAQLFFSLHSLVDMSFLGRQEFFFNLFGNKNGHLWMFQAMFSEIDFKGPVLRDWYPPQGNLALWSARSQNFLTSRYFPFYRLFLLDGVPHMVEYSEPVPMALSHLAMLSMSSGLRLYETLGSGSDTRLLAVGPSRLLPTNTILGQWRIGKQQELDSRNWDSLQRMLLFLTIAPFLLALVIGRRLVAPLIELREMAARVARGDYQARLTEGRSGEYGLLASAFRSMTSSLAGGKLLQLFVSESVKETVRTRQKNTVERPTAEHRLVLFISPAGFHKRLGEVNPTQVLTELNGFLEVASREIRLTGGDVDKFIGEKILAAYSLLPGERPGQLFVRMIPALESIMAWSRTFTAWQRYPLAVGLVWGPLLVGRLGSEDVRLEQALIGDTVNLASRLCDLAGKRGGNSCLLDAQTGDLLGSDPEAAFTGHLEHLGVSTIKGKRREIEVMELFFQDRGP